LPNVTTLRALLCALTLNGLCGLACAQETTRPLISVDAAATEASTTSSLFEQGAEPAAGTSVTKARNFPALTLRTTETVVIARWNGGELTNTQLSATLQMRRPRSAGDMPVAQIFSLQPQRQREIVKDMAYELILFDKAKAEGITEDTPAIAETLKNYRHQALARLYYQREVEPQLQQLDEKAARAYYEAHKELYVTPAQTMAIDLHLSTYRMYTAKAGDTLDKLAEETGATTGSATPILRGVPPFYPRMPISKAKAEVPVLPLKEGERLLLPLSADEISSKSKLAQELHKRALAGETAGDLLEKYSEHGELAPGPKMFPVETSLASPEIKAAVARARDTSVTDVVRTPYGFDILFLLDRSTTQTQPFEEVREKLVTELTSDTESVKQTVEKKRAEVMVRLAKQFGLQLNEDVLRRKDYAGADPLTANSAIATAENFTYTLEEFLHDLQPTGKSWQNMTAEERIDFARNSPAVASYLIERAAINAGLDKTPRFAEEMHSKAVLEVTSEYLREKLQKQVSTVTDADLRAYYNDHIDRYTSPSQVIVREITKRVNLTLPPDRKVAAIEEAKKALADVRSKIHSQADFEQFARRESEAIATRSRGGLLGRVSENFRGEMFRNQLQGLKPGEITEPFLYGNEVMIVRLDERTPPTVQSFEEAFRRIRDDYMREVPRKKTEQFRDRILEEAGLKLLI
jgi:parvulin-like peptidyl-prolyl isomerase